MEPIAFLPEGGELRLERVQIGPTDGEDSLAAHAFFFKGQEPAFRSLNGTAIPIRAALTDMGYVCQDFRSGTNFDNGYSPQAQAIADTREYYDVGDTATLTQAANAGEVITLQKFLAADDANAATDRSALLVHDVLYRAVEPPPVTRNATYLPAIAGSATYPALELRYGEAATGEALADPATGEGTPQLYMPSAFTLTEPAEADFYTPGAMTFTRGEDFNIFYALSEDKPADWPTIVPFIGFADDTGKIEAYCLRVTVGRAEDGQFIVPHEVLEIVQPAPTTGYVIFGRLIHAAWETQQDTTRLDLIGIEAKLSTAYVIQDAAAARR